MDSVLSWTGAGSAVESTSSWNGAGSGGHCRAVGFGGADTWGRSEIAELDGTSGDEGGHLRGSGTGIGCTMTDGCAILLAGGLSIFSGGLAIHFASGLRLAANGGGFRRRGLDFSADLTDFNDGSSTFALSSALLDAH